MSHTQRNLRTFDPDDSSCTRLIEALADGNPIPDTSDICPDRQQLIALLAEISKGERSELCRNTQPIAERYGLSIQDIASRATFLLACLETPGGDDPYTILGVAPTATAEEIKEAWLSRLSLYHPDRHPENADWFTRQAARLNEAYHTLKDPARRHAYDERSRRELFARQPSGLVAIRPDSSESASTPSQTLRLKRHRAMALIAVGLAAAVGLILTALSDRHSGSPQLYLETVQPMAAVGLPSPTPINDPPSATPTRGGSPTSPAPSVAANSHQQPERKRLKRVRYMSPPPGLPSDQFASSDNPIVPQRSAAGPIHLAQVLPPVAPEAKALERQEIDALLDEYIDAYEKADVDRVMATLSTRVREKGTLDYQAIRNAYIKGFAGRDQIIYRLKNVQVEIKGEQATVTAQYLILARNAAQSSKGITISGRIEWKLQREGDKLKIVAINY